MKFSVEGSRIICSRKDNTVKNKEVYRRVVEFDSHVESVPPHVASRLTSGEIEQLQEFLADRKRIQANPAEKNMLEALPGLLREATAILRSVDTVNKTMYEQLLKAIGELSDSLNDVRPASAGAPTAVNRMHNTEAQKERLENIKQDL